MLGFAGSAASPRRREHGRQLGHDSSEMQSNLWRSSANARVQTGLAITWL
jgi:hypothetical protein